MDSDNDREFQVQSARAKAWLLEIVEGSPIPTFVVDASHTVTHWNHACEIVTGTKAADVVGTTRAWAPFYPNERPVMANLIIDKILDVKVGEVYRDKCRPSEIIANAWEAEDFFPHLPGGGKWLAFCAVALRGDDGNIVAAIETLRDVTKEKRLLAELNQAKESIQRHLTQLSDAANSIDQGISMFDPEMRLVVWNRRFVELIDMPEEFVSLGLPLEELFRFNAERGEYGVGEVESLVAAQMETARLRIAHRYERTRPNGIVLEIAGWPLSNGGFVSTYTDVTERHRKDAELRAANELLEQRVKERTRELSRSEQRFRDLAQSASDWFWETDADLRYTYMSERFFETSGLRPEDFIGKTRREIVATSSLRDDPDPWAEKFADREGYRPFRDAQFRMIGEGGREVFIRVNGTPYYDEAGTFMGYRGTGSDVTELVRAHADLMRSEKMAALGGLVAGVAHEINTPVGIALTAASHLQKETGTLVTLHGENRMKRSDLIDYTKLAAELTGLLMVNLNRAADLIHSFKQVAVDQTSDERRRFNLAKYIDEILMSLQPTLRKTPHKVVVECPSDLVMESYPGALSHVLTNLVVNALIHGLDDRRPGTIRIAVSPEHDRVLLIFSDDGRGIPPEHINRIFDPFFTTKRGEGGSGLGLNVVFNSVTTNLQGSIVCDSPPGCGATFTIRLPVALSDATVKGR